MDLRQLEFVLAVVDTGGFTRAAAAVHVAQPSLSARVRALERELGVDLFHRLGRGVRLTPAGELVVDHARLVLGEVTALRSAATAAKGVVAGSLEIVALPTLAVDPVAGFVGRFRLAHPGVTVRIAESDDAGGRGGVPGLVRAGVAELGFAELPTSARDLIAVALPPQELFAVLPPAPHDSRPVRLREVAGLPLVLTPPGTSTRGVVDAALGNLGLEPEVAVEVAQREAIVPLVLAGAGAGFLPGAQAEAARAQGASVRSLDPPLVRRIGVLHRRGRLSPAAEAFLAGLAQPKRPVM